MKDSTLRDVAKLSGLSIGTVSRYLNGHSIKERNREKILNAVNMLDFSPNPLARNLAKGISHSVLLYMIAESPIVTSTWIHALPIIQGISDVIRNSKFSLSIEIAPMEDAQNIADTIEKITRSKRADGLVILTNWEDITKQLLPLEYKKFPYFVIGPGNNLNEDRSIDFDNISPIMQIVQYQYELGHRRFAMIGGFAEQYHMRDRLKGYLNALTNLNIPVRQEYIMHGDYTFQSGYNCAREMISYPEPPTMILCGNDYIAAGAIKAIHQAKLKVPFDISVSGFDATALSELTDPSITTVRIDAYGMGKIAIEKLLGSIEKKDNNFKKTVIQSEVIFRESTGIAR
jgi:LacI family transcriptional regulator